MSRRKFNREGQIPHNLNEMINIKFTGEHGVCKMDDILSSMHIRSWFPNTEEWYHFLDNVLSDWIYNNYKLRPFRYDLINEFESPFNNYCVFISQPQEAYWSFRDWGNDYDALTLEISNICHNVFLANQEKYKKLFDAMTLEFNPLWNVDGVETTTRLLQKEGTEKNEHKGKDTLKKRGEEKNEKSGDDTLTKGGSEIIEDRGNDKVKHDGYTSTVDSGKEINTKTGSRDNTRTGGETTIKSEATTDAQAYLNVQREVKQYSDNNSLDYVKDSETFNQYADTTEFQSRERRNNLNTTDTTQYGKTETKRFDEYEEKQNYDSSNTLSFTNREDEQNFDSYTELSFDDRKDRETTTHERHGNIGVTTTTKLLTELVDYSQYFNYVDIVAKDLINAICEGVY